MAATELGTMHRTFQVKSVAALIQAFVLSGVILLAMPSGSRAETAVDALHNIGPGTQDAQICSQMQNYSELLAKIRSEALEYGRRSSWRRVCNILGQATGALAEMVAFMRAHIGECNITAASLLQTVAAASEMAQTRAQHCR